MKKTLLALLLVTAGCSIQTPFGKTNVGDPDANNDLSYSYNDNGCDTHKVKYKNDDDHCAALKDDARNNYCALNLRYEAFKQLCPGKSWQ